MSLVYNEEQRMLADSARDFLSKRSPVSAQRALRDAGTTLGYDPDVWQKMTELGWTGIPFAEENGGLAFGIKGLGAIFEEIGRHLSASPLLSSVAMAGQLLEQAGSQAQRDQWLEAVISGRNRLALAVDEGARHDPLAMPVSAQADGDCYKVSVTKTMVIDGHDADGWIVAVRTAGEPGDAHGISLFLVSADTPGVTTTRLALMDSRNAAELVLDGVKLGTEQRIGEAGQGFAALDAALDYGRVCLAAEIVGACDKLFADTIEYLQTREQFDAPIGANQGLQHRASWLYVEVSLARSALMAALDAVDNQAKDAARLVSLAKYKAGRLALRMGNEAVQMHGGIGVTDELDVGLYLKRLRVAQASLGDCDFHVGRYTALSQ